MLLINGLNRMIKISSNIETDYMINKKLKCIQDKKNDSLMKKQFHLKCLNDDYCPKCIKKLVFVMKGNSRVKGIKIFYCFSCMELFESFNNEKFIEDSEMHINRCYFCNSYVHYNALRKIKVPISKNEFYEYEIETVDCETCSTIYPL